MKGAFLHIYSFKLMSPFNLSFRQDVVFLLCCTALAFLLQGCGEEPGPGKMMCGDSVPLCGVLVLQSGYGSGPYKHPEPTVHGLWPQTGHYGNSKCLRPDSGGNPEQIYPCYNQKGETRSELARFQKHEWDKHGRCAGVDSATDYFKQICTLSSSPLRIMKQERSEGADLHAMSNSLENAGYPVHELDKHTSEIHLSACAGPGGDWKLSRVEDFPQKCGTGGGSATQCVPGQQGPKCSSDSDCQGMGGCVRCAKSGYCTDVKIALHRKISLGQTRKLSPNLADQDTDYWTQVALVNQAV